MDSKVANVAAAQNPTLGQSSAPPRSLNPPSVAAPIDQAQDPAGTRLIIEEDSVAGTYVYKTVDRLSGQVIHQWPREEVLKMKDQAGYLAGDVVDAKV